MSKRKNTGFVGVYMPEASRHLLDREAEALTTVYKSVNASDVVRLALELYFQNKYGERVNYGVDRGGYRERKANE